MKILKHYKYKQNGIIIVSSKLQEGAEKLETMNILEADEGKELYRDNEKIGVNIWLKDGDVAENYTERKIENITCEE